MGTSIQRISSSYSSTPAWNSNGEKRLVHKAGIGLQLFRSSLLAGLTWTLGLMLFRFGNADEPASVPHPSSGSCTLTLVRRSIAQDQGAWILDYQMRHMGPSGVILSPSDISARLEGWVSNSRVPSHTIPRFARVTVNGSSTSSATGDVIASSDELQRCRERVIISAWADDAPPREGDTPGLISLAPLGKLHVRLRIEHQHVLFGDYDPLLGIQNIELSLGSGILTDQVSLDHEHYLAQPKCVWPEPPKDRRDTAQFISAPDSLHLEAHIPGHMYYRYPERPVRYATRMRLRFWYLIAAGTEGECRVRLAQYKDTPTSWRPLSNGAFDQPLETIGRWTKVERIVQTDSEATTVALDFRIIGDTAVGEMWIDDLSLEPLGCPAQSGSP